MKPEEYEPVKRGYAQIDLDSVSFNVESMLKNMRPGARMVLVIKTDGYGHGAYPIARMYDDDDRIWGYAVACPEEAWSLRDDGIKKPILILGYAFPYSYEECVRKQVRCAVFREDMLDALQDAAAKTGQKAYVHIKVDTGMSRIGIRPDEDGIAFVKKAFEYPDICVEGIFTHFARADEADRSDAEGQFERFTAFTDRIKNELGYDIGLKHCSNSAGIIEMPQANMDMVRAGITLYGLWPSDEVSKDKVPLKPVMSFISHISYIKSVPAGTRISYGGTYIADKDRLIATVPVGYGDGYPRLLSNRGEVIVRGRRVPICGRVCMDQFMIDVTDVEGVCEEDRVTLIGTDGDESVTMEELGDISGRFNYELACDIGRRIPRVYTCRGEITDISADGRRMTSVP